MTNSFQYFDLDEFICRCGCGVNNIDEMFVDKLDVLRDLYGAPLVVTSGYRCPKHEKEVGGSGRNHPRGVAADVLAPKGELLKRLLWAFSMLQERRKPLRRMVLYRHKPHVHIDDNPDLKEGVWIK